ncbi:hypothetical protein V6N12_028919 [Hibiscus sabdariffa]|uniref:Zinc finger, CCHC-type n=1 Tax=Hibiscus sabdariffa TaxID=183260 RepID=A0ABR2F794_9ROSI
MANNNLSLRSLLEKEKLNGINFLDWFRNLRIVLKQERKEYVIEELVLDEPAAKGKKKAKFKGNGKSKPKGKDALKLEKGISKDGKCFHCDKTGH